MLSKLLPSIFTVLLLTACGGGSDGEGSGATLGAGTGGSTITLPTEPGTTGSTSSPRALSLADSNTFGTDPFFNNFRYVASAGEKLVIRVNPNIPLSTLQSRRCAESPGTGSTPSNFQTQVHVYNSLGIRVGGICGEDLTFTFASAGTYLLNFEFTSNGGGTFNAASLTGSTPIQFSETGNGSPTLPKKLSTLTGNTIGSNPFNAYYWVQATQGETLVLGVQLKTPLTQLERTRCEENAESPNKQLRVFDAGLTQVAVACGESMRFVVPSAGIYVVQADYGVNGVTLNASRL